MLAVTLMAIGMEVANANMTPRPLCETGISFEGIFCIEEDSDKLYVPICRTLEVSWRCLRNMAAAGHSCNAVRVGCCLAHDHFHRPSIHV